jgi:hypothetical protein
MRSVLSITSTVVSSHDRSSVTSLGTIDDEDSTLSQETSPPLGWKDTFRETSARSNSIYQAPSTPLTITLEVILTLGPSSSTDPFHSSQMSTNGNKPSRCDLKTFVGHNTLLFRNASFCFRFTFQLPDPNYEERQHLTQSQAPSNLVARTPQKLWVCLLVSLDLSGIILIFVLLDLSLSF